MQRNPDLKEQRHPFYGRNAISVKHFAMLPGQGCFGAHWHSRIEILRIRKGGLHVTLKGDRRYHASAGEVVFVAPLILHQGKADEQGVDYDVVMFETSSFLNGVPVVQEVLQQLTDGLLLFDEVTAEPEIVAVVDSIVQRGKEQLWQGVADVYRLVGAMLRLAHPSQVFQKPSEQWLGQVLAYVNAHWSEPLTTRELARRFGYTEPYFCRRFKQTTGTSLGRYVEILRLEKSKMLLVQTEDPVNRIAAQCAFGDAAYYTARFRMQYGITPSRYRKERRKAGWMTEK